MVCPFLLVPQMFSLATSLLMEYSVMSTQTSRGVLCLQNVVTVSRYEHAYKPHFVCERKEGTAVRVSIFLKRALCSVSCAVPPNSDRCGKYGTNLFTSVNLAFTALLLMTLAVI